MQLRDPALLMSIIGLSPKKHSRALKQELDAYTVATSNEGLLCIRKYWDSHCSTAAKLPAIALLDTSSYPRGLSCVDFVQLLSRITTFQLWQIWDLWDTLDVHSCGYIGCQEFTLLVVLMCAGMAQQQLRALHAYHSSICRVFAGAHVISPLAGVVQCCQLMDVPLNCLAAAMQELQIKLQHPPAGNNSLAAGSSCGVGGSSRNDVKAAIKASLQTQESNTPQPAPQSGSCSSRTDGSRVEGSSLLSSSRQAEPGSKLSAGHGSNKVAPEQSTSSSSQVCCGTEGATNIITSTLTKLYQDIQLLLYHAIGISGGSQGLVDGKAGRFTGDKPSISGPVSREASTESISALQPLRRPKPSCISCLVS